MELLGKDQEVCLIGGGVALRVGFEFSKAHPRPVFSLWSPPVDQDVKVSATAPVQCLPASRHDDDHGLTL